ncbi:BPSS1780 family membrane protein [Candidatus Vallotiella sp. (ex Adelges kitamiensis)]|uniref:BPSS1780 family membrane protein n=1 Tax=Candidatus Vallotiella sp. (ex Adelges kitamiensis) TaxID=2864217 RepID=UPI001CE3A718|nr:BPSS1780 family membrane protein [Candidatus Vallotia sp. (ex Adelges kitamiensis)]
MKLIETSAKFGYIWIGKGIWLFHKNPLNLLAIFFTYVFSMTLIVHIPVVGSVLWLILVPGLYVGFMSACRDVLAGKHVFPLALFTGFRAHSSSVSWQLLQLGLIYCALVTTSLFLTSIIDDGWLLKTVIIEVKPDNNVAHSSALISSIVLGFLIYLPTMMLFWFAPLLTAWHGVPPIKSMFFSFVVCWRNRITFLVYLATWFAVIISASLVIGFILNVFGLSSGALTALLPVSMILWTIIYCSFYASYCSCFNREQNASPEFII